MRKLVLLFLVLLPEYCGLVAQIAPDKYFVEFKDKNATPYSLDRPSEFLSERSIIRRQDQGVSLDSNDLPVNPSYVSQVAVTGANVLNRSKWMNGITIRTTDPKVIAAIEQLPFVKGVTKNKYDLFTSSVRPDKFKYENLPSTTDAFVVPYSCESMRKSVNGQTAILDYGLAWSQVSQLRGNEIHALGYHGEGKIIAILDAGFLNADQIGAFDSLRVGNQILGTRDFVEPGGNVYLADNHGTAVLSTMGANLPGLIIGTAPKASYFLFRTEDTGSEYLVEEYNWVCGAEAADSAGADIINSSLGYTTFDDPSMNHSCSDMDGNSTVVTRGANIAVSKGMIVVNSAGNSGGNPGWRCVCAPSDGRSVIAVAAVDSLGNYASFSSVGKVETTVKPNIAAMGSMTAVCDPYNNVYRGYGTSFASPLIAGMTACLWQAAQDYSNFNIIRAIEISAHQASSPDTLLGYGIPNFIKALNMMNIKEIHQKPVLKVYPNPFTDRIILNSEAGEAGVRIELITSTGSTIRSQTTDLYPGKTLQISTSDLPSGYYLLRLTGQNDVICKPIIKR